MHKMERVKRNISKTKTKKKKVKGFHQKMKLFRTNDPKLSVIMWGVNHSMSQMMHIPQPIMLMKDDFKAYSKIKIDNHLYNKDNMPSHFKFKEYMPLVFRNIRERLPVDEALFMNSFQLEPRITTASGGKSGSQFLTTHDRRFYIKTIVREEVEMMHSIMPKYHQYIVESNSNTLLPQYLAMYRTTVDNKEYYYLVCRNVFNNQLKIHKKYDLKGSRIDREAKDKEMDHDLPTYKDNDFTKDNMKINLGAETREHFFEKLKKDVNFLGSLNIMDYSLLIGIHDKDRADEEDEEDCEDGCEGYSSGDNIDDDSGDNIDSGNDHADPPLSSSPPDEVDMLGRLDLKERCNSMDNAMLGAYDPDIYAVESADESRNEIYYMGIIDVLTYYGATKKAAHAAKTVKHGAHADISTVKPQLYATRFVEFLEGVFE